MPILWPNPSQVGVIIVDLQCHGPHVMQGTCIDTDGHFLVWLRDNGIHPEYDVLALQQAVVGRKQGYNEQYLTEVFHSWLPVYRVFHDIFPFLH